LPLLLVSCQPSAQENTEADTDSLSNITAVELTGGETPDGLKRIIRKLDKTLKAEDGTIKDKSQGVEYVQTIKTLANRFPSDPEVPRLLSTAAETCRGIGANNEALALYGQVYQTYPNHPLAAPALFIQGFILENELKQKEQARKNYEKFMESYPTHEFAEIVKSNLKQLDMSPDELVKEFQKNRK